MGRGNPAEAGKPEYLFQCPDQFFKSAALHKEGMSLKAIREDAGDAKAAELGQELAGLSVANRDEQTQDDAGDQNASQSGDAGDDSLTRFTCNRCRFLFQTWDEQRAHFKSDLHRFNVKRRSRGKEPISEDDFTKVAEGGSKGDIDDVSSISGSDSESDDPNSTDGFRRNTHKTNRIHFVLQDSGQSFSLWRVLALSEREYLQTERCYAEEHNDVLYVSEDNLLLRLKSLVPPTLRIEDNAVPKHIWVVLLSAGGHFAGVVMNMQGGGVLAHHTFHRYVVRAKAGGRQSTRDATGRAPKSAGASLRRYNEMALQKEIRDLLASWGDYLRSASHIFVYAPSANGQALFGGENAPLNRNDLRLRRIPFTTRRPTFKEAQRVFRVLASITYEEESPTSIETPIAMVDGSAGAKKEAKLSVKKSDAGQGSADSSGQSTAQNPADGAGSSGSEVPALNPSTPLHEAAKSGNCEEVLRLLEDGMDPCARDGRDRTPYSLAGDKETRNVFRRYMARFPDQWDWHAANVPSALTEEMELAQAAREAEKKAKRKEIEKERKKLRKEHDRKKEAEKKAAELAAAAVASVRGTSQVKSFTKTPAPDTKSAAYQAAVAKAQAAERDARAAAAEARMRALIAANNATDGQSTSTPSRASGSSSGGAKGCSCCGASLVGKTPFYKFSYSYCSTTCVQVHRKYLENEGQ
ncbi:ankyrin repeat and zinc finger domain-containing protein 1 [Marchantia polymorpha subsp. ruderalis]|uniref:VLRF1 domain-containing protein n=1 Tax=Marchantia polymorpha TaxID=3197 RepID=A0A2R6XMU6_MARPO|nr:hypothetical protein MARPO_0008s0196 [Marchantia polymorpha]BBN19387.1 hypothetical protein Mp_8g10260 [Marchantia polymorpha subsp. ruderalis]|eukprot:PTQ47445.1 hypothetical protein MARPO_0008s0196 [Marchantia polymorpha]